MAPLVEIRAGETQQLRASADPEHWVSSNPKIVAVSDEDLIRGIRGGMLTAFATGQARITALGFNGESLLEVDVRVVGAASLVLRTSESAQLESVHGSGWRSDRPQVAEIDSHGTVHAVSPGIALVSCETAEGSRTTEVRVTGTVIVEPNQTFSLAERFSVRVMSWTSSSDSAASIDSEGRVTAGDRPRLVSITAHLVSGEDFSVDLQIRHPAAAQQGHNLPPVQPQAADTLAADRQPTPPRSPFTRAEGSGWSDQQHEVQRHLASAEASVTAGNWQGAGIHFAAARIAAGGDDRLSQLVLHTEQRLRATIQSIATSNCLEILSLVARGEFEQVGRMAEGAALPSLAQNLVRALMDLSRLLQDLAEGKDFSDERATELQGCLNKAWDESLSAGILAILPELGRIAVDWDLQEMAVRFVRALCSEASAIEDRGLRSKLESQLKCLDRMAFPAVLACLTSTADGTRAGDWLLDLLIGIEPGKHGSALVAFYSEQNRASQEHIVKRLCKLAQQSWPTLFEMLAGVYRRVPLDDRIAAAIRARLGSSVLEKEAVKWAAAGHAGAQVVLRRMFGYSGV